jgi:hypothetical protein
VARFVDAVASARAEEAGAGRIRRRWLYGGQIAIGGILTLVGVAVPIVARGQDEAPYWMALVLAAVLLAAGVATLWARWRKLPLPAALAPAAGFVVAYLFAVTFVYPALEPRKSARFFSEKAAAATAESRAAGHEVVAYDLSNLPEAFAFYGDGLYTVVTKDPEVLAEHLRQPDEVWAVVHRPGLDELPQGLRDRLVIVHEDRLSRRNVVLLRNHE